MFLLPSPILLLLLFTSQGASSQPHLVADPGAKYSIADGVHELSIGRLRTERALVDFEMAFEFRAASAEFDAGVLVRTWTGYRAWPERGYRMLLPTKRSKPSSILSGRREKVEVLETGLLELRPAGEWQRVELSADRRRIRITVNDVRVGEFAIDSVVGPVQFESRKGILQIRNISILARPIDSTIPADVISFAQLRAAGGRDPEVIREIKPQYTSEAMTAKVEGLVNVEAVVRPNGTVGAVRVLQSLHPDLDAAAVTAVRAWEFRPAMLRGRAVPVLVEVALTFTLK